MSIYPEPGWDAGPWRKLLIADWSTCHPCYYQCVVALSRPYVRQRGTFQPLQCGYGTCGQGRRHFGVTTQWGKSWLWPAAVAHFHCFPSVSLVMFCLPCVLSSCLCGCKMHIPCVSWLAYTVCFMIDMFNVKEKTMLIIGTFVLYINNATKYDC